MLELSLMGQGTSSKQPKGGKDLFWLLVSEGSVFDSADSEPVVKRNRMVTGNMWQRLLTSRQTGKQKGTSGWGLSSGTLHLSPQSLISSLQDSYPSQNINIWACGKFSSPTITAGFIAFWEGIIENTAGPVSLCGWNAWYEFLSKLLLNLSLKRFPSLAKAGHLYMGSQQGSLGMNRQRGRCVRHWSFVWWGRSDTNRYSRHNTHWCQLKPQKRLICSLHVGVRMCV